MSNSTVDNLHLHKLEIVDYVIFVLTLIISLLIGFYYAFTGGKQKTVQEYLVGDRKMGVFPVTMSLLATILSAMGMISMPAEVYMYSAGLQYSALGMCLALPVVAFCYLPTFYELQLTSAYEYLELRFNSTLRKLGSLICICQFVVYISLVLYAPSLAMSQVTGLSLWGSVIAVGALGTIYTALGGIKAVMWTDVFQIVVVFTSLAISITKGVIDVGGISHVFNKGIEGGRLKLSMEFDLRIRYSVWSVTIASFFKWLGYYGIAQTVIQRYVSSPSLAKAKLTVFLNLFGNVLFQTCALIGGLVIYAKYWNCDPLTTKMVQAPDQLLPLFVIETLYSYPGLTGFFIAGLFCGSLSTISSALNSLAAMMLEDFIKSFKRWKNISSEKAATVSKILTASFGVLCLALVPAFSGLGSIIQASYYNSHTFLGVIFALFTLGLFVPWANSFGASVGIIVGLVFAQWMSIGTQLHPQFTPKSPMSTAGCLAANTSLLVQASKAIGNSLQDEEIFPLYQISFPWIMTLSALPVIFVGMIASALHNPTKLENLDVRLLSPVVRVIVKRFWPKKCKKPPERDGMLLVPLRTDLLKEKDVKCNS